MITGEQNVSEETYKQRFDSLFKDFVEKQNANIELGRKNLEQKERLIKLEEECKGLKAKLVQKEAELVEAGKGPSAGVDDKGRE